MMNMLPEMNGGFNPAIRTNRLPTTADKLGDYYSQQAIIGDAPVEHPSVDEPSPVEEQPAEEPTPASQPTFKRQTNNFFMPSRTEMKAEQEGRRWNHNLEHSWMLPGSNWEKSVQANAALEQRGANDNSRQQAATIRGIMQQYNNLINARSNGQYPDDEQFEQVRQQYLSQLEAAGFDTSTLAPPPPDPVKWQQLNSSNMQKLYSDIKETEFFAEELADAEQAGDEALKANHLTQVFDKYGQRLLAKIGGDSGSMADAEKKRMQIQMMPSADRDRFIKSIKGLVAGLNSAQANMTKRTMSQDLKNKLDAISTAVSKGDFLLAAGEAIVSLTHENIKELPAEFASYMESIKSAYDILMENTMYAANIDRAAIYNLAKYYHDDVQHIYNSHIDRLGASESRKSTSKMAEVSRQFLDDMTNANKDMWLDAFHTIGYEAPADNTGTGKGTTEGAPKNVPDLPPQYLMGPTGRE